MTKFNQFAETNMPTTDIMNLVNVSMSGDSWKIENGSNRNRQNGFAVTRNAGISAIYV